MIVAANGAAMQGNDDGLNKTRVHRQAECQRVLGTFRVSDKSLLAAARIQKAADDFEKAIVSEPLELCGDFEDGLGVSIDHIVFQAIVGVFEADPTMERITPSEATATG